MTTNAASSQKTGNTTDFIDSQVDLTHDQVNLLFDKLFPEIKRIARIQLNKHFKSNDISPTVLVNECYIKLHASKGINIKNTKHFFCIVSQCMRYFLMDLLRKQYTDKNKKYEIELDHEVLKDDQADVEYMFALNHAIDQLAYIDKQLTDIVQLRFFAGFTIKETGLILGIDNNRVYKQWITAKSILLEIIDKKGSLSMRN